MMFWLHSTRWLSLSPYCIMMGTTEYDAVPASLSWKVTRTSTGAQRLWAAAAGRRSASTTRARSRAKVFRNQTLGLHATIDSSNFYFPRGSLEDAWWEECTGTYPGFQAPCGRLHRQDFSVSPAPMLSSSHHEIACKFLSKRERERDCLQMTARTGARSRVVCALVHGSHDRNWKKCSGTNGDVLSAASNPSLSWVWSVRLTEALPHLVVFMYKHSVYRFLRFTFTRKNQICSSVLLQSSSISTREKKKQSFVATPYHSDASFLHRDFGSNDIFGFGAGRTRCNTVSDVLLSDGDHTTTITRSLQVIFLFPDQKKEEVQD
jgi:hypothetical protein